MKRILSIILVITLFASFSLVAKKKQADIKFAEYSYNFGTIPEKGGQVSHTFSFTNTGDANLIIVDATADCGCTRPSYTDKPIAPGKKGAVKVTFNPDLRPGAFTKVITVRSNAKQKKVRLKITGIVNRNK